MELQELCSYVKTKVETSNYSIEDYISTENMLPEKGGITIASSFPSGKVTEFQENDILISNIRPYFKKIWRANRSGCCSNDVLCIRANNNVDAEFLYYLLSQDLFFAYVMSGANGSKMPRGDKQQIMNWEIEIPSEKEDQRRIASILSSLDRKIELNNKINADLEEMAQAIFKSWFVDFEPFKDGKFVDSELGMIPEGWKVISLSEIMKYNGGSQPPASEFIDTYQEGYIRFIQIRDYDNDSHITYIPISKRNKLCDELDIMIARYGAALGRICWGLKGAYNVALAKVTPIKSYYREYLRCYLNTSYF